MVRLFYSVYANSWLDGDQRQMLSVKWLVVRCVMYLFRLPNYQITE